MINPFGHIGDKCRQAVNVLAESIASTVAVGDMAHVFRNTFKATTDILNAAKAALKAVLFDNRDPG